MRERWRFRDGSGKGKVDMKGDGSRGGPPRRTLSRLEQSQL